MEPIEAASETVQAAAQAAGDLQFYCLSFALACAAGLVRTHRDHRYRDFGNLVSTSLGAGFIGLGCVLLLGWVSGGRAGHEPGLMAAAIFVGLAGKEADKIYPKVIEWVFKRLGVELEDPGGKTK